ncbi:GntR family transcriptional regulator [Actinomadura kijaniata]|uniref:GntR family transcriptional regulator n=1 Tax=Actinomadura kijaniata TaxID=46161 RepID=UPI0008377D5F|nr:GntR family transcriptional regulator [Actinomadura kijaniata]
MTRRTSWGVYLRITAVLRQRLSDGTYAPGTRLPSEAALCGEFKVSRNTVRRALVALETDGLISVVNGVGRFVPDPEATEQGKQRPKHERIAADLCAQINNGTLAPGDALPSEARISKRYGVTRFTARQAFAVLEGDGLVETMHGKGRFVLPRRP